MAQNKKGFTVVELLAVIVVLAIVITIATSSALGILNKAREGTSREMRGSLADIALTYAIDNFYLQKCSVTFSKEVYEQGNISNLASNGDCAKKVTVETLKTNNLFEDNHGYCKLDDYVVVYRYSDGATSEYKTYVEDSVCTSY